MERYLVCCLLFFFSLIRATESCLGCKMKSMRLVKCPRDNYEHAFTNVSGLTLTSDCHLTLRGTAVVTQTISQFSIKVRGNIGNIPVNFEEAEGCNALNTIKNSPIIGGMLKHYGSQDFQKCPIEKAATLRLKNKLIMMAHRPVLPTLQGRTNVTVTLANINGSKKIGCFVVTGQLKCGG